MVNNGFVQTLVLTAIQGLCLFHRPDKLYAKVDELHKVDD
jgi:hypothetical protein